MTDTDDSNPVSPGALLKKARAKAGWSLEEVARELYLSTTKVQALEQDHYDKLPSPSAVFAQGYLRKYAKLVGLPEQEIVDTWHQYQAAQHAAMAPPEPEVEVAKPARLPPRWIIPAGVFGVAAAVLAVIVVFVTDRGPSPVSSAGLDQPASEAVVPESGSDTAGELADTPASDDTPIASVLAAANEAVGQDTEESAEAGVDTSPGASTDVGTQDLPALALEEEIAIQSELETEAETAQADAENSDAEPLATMTFSFTEDCWLQVSDVNGKVLFAQVVPGGQSREMNGLAPLRVVLGKARAASIVFNGESVPVDVSPGRETARLVLGE